MKAPSLVAAALLGAALIGCGGGSTSSTGSEAAEEVAPKAPEGEDGGRRSHLEGSEEMLEKVGTEAQGSEKEAVLGAEHAYLTAVVSGDYGGACSHVSQSIERSLQAMVPAAAGKRSCAEILANLVGPDAARVLKPQLGGKVVRVRLNGDKGFVIFRAPGARLYAFPMSQEGGSWRVGALNAEVLAPSAATLGEG